MIRAHGGTPGTFPPPQNGAGTLTVNYEGQQFTISAAATQFLRLGTGAAAEWVQVTNAGSYDPNTGLGAIVVTRNTPPPVVAGAIGATRLNLPAGTGVRHENGDAVMNVIPGNPGPQAGFSPRGANYQAVVPYFVRID
jgi:hypothetical protein